MARLVAEECLDVDFRVAGAEVQPCDDGFFDVVTANQCWLYFDAAKTVSEVKRLLAADGVLVTSHFCWLPRLDPVAKATEELVLKHNPAWTASDYSGEIPQLPPWAFDTCDVAGDVLFRRADRIFTRNVARPHAGVPRCGGGVKC